MSSQPDSATGLSPLALGAFLRHPAMVGSAFPATRRMVRRMLAPVDWAAIDVLVEYGPGTGRFTLAALARMKPAARLLAIETGAEFVDHLRGATDDQRLVVVHGSASDVLTILADHGAMQADCILSGLPFSTLAREEAEHLMEVSRQALGRSGLFAAYQMRTAIEARLRESFATVSKAYEWWNIPPCHLYWARNPRR